MSREALILLRYLFIKQITITVMATAGTCRGWPGFALAGAGGLDSST